MTRAIKEGMVVHRHIPGQPLTSEQKKQLEALAKMKVEDIDFSDIPELTEKFWKNAVRGIRSIDQ
jgi:hypothetical protein